MKRVEHQHSDSTFSDLSQSMQSHLRVIAKVSLALSFFSMLILGLTVFLVFADAPQTDYFKAIQTAARDQDQFIIAMLIGGALIILLAGLMTWFITLYSSARVAGPLYRFARNIEMEIEHGPVAIIQLREDDKFQHLAAKLDAVVTDMNDYYGDQLLLIDNFERKLSSSEKFTKEHFKELLQQLDSVVVRR